MGVVSEIGNYFALSVYFKIYLILLSTWFLQKVLIGQ